MQHFDTELAAKYLGLSTRTLERWRLDGRGPEFRKFGRRVLYEKSVLAEWAQCQSRSTTSQTKGKTGAGQRDPVR